MMFLSSVLKLNEYDKTKLITYKLKSSVYMEWNPLKFCFTQTASMVNLEVLKV